MQQGIENPRVSPGSAPDSVHGCGRDGAVQGVGKDFFNLFPVQGPQVHAVSQAVVPELVQRLGQPGPRPARRHHAGPARRNHVSDDAGGSLIKVVGVIHHQQQRGVFAVL